MSESIKSILSKIKGFWSGLEKKKKSSFILMGILFAIGLSVLLILFTRTTYTVMYTGLDVYEAGEIYTKLTDLGADVKLKNNTTILINETQEDEFRMTLATEGYPRTGLSYDIYTDNVSMGISESEKQTYILFQLQDRLQNTIKTLKGVNGAVVTISKPDETLFVLESQKKPITAAVVIDVASGYSLSSANVKAIEHLVAKSISGLSNENITIIDTQMNVLNRKSDSEIGTASEKYELQKSLENEIENKVISIIEPVFGFGNVKVAASIKMDYSKISEQKTEFTPVNDEDGIPYSITEKKETVIDSQSATLDNDNDTILGSEATSSETVTQLYVNQNTTSIEHENGVIDDIKLSIMINSPGVTDDMLTNIQKMAANAVGGSETDIIVQAVEFAISNDVDDALSNAVVNTANVSFLLDPDFILKSVMIITMFVLGLMIITILKKGLAKTKNQTASTTRAKYESLDLEQLGQKKNPEDDYRSEIEKYVDKNPEGVANILKKWISED